MPICCFTEILLALGDDQQYLLSLRVRTYKERIVIGLGMALCVALVGIGAWLAWASLLDREAVRYGATLSERLRQTVAHIDQITQSTFTPAYYAVLHRQPLATLQLDDDPTVQQFIRRLDDVIRNPIGGGALFTECPAADLALCYYDFLFGVPNVRDPKNYSPKGRPWYILTHGHTNWVVFPFFPTKSAVPGFPKIPSIGFAKRIVVGADEAPTDGIWLVLFTPAAATSASSPLLEMLFHGAPPPMTLHDLSISSTVTFSQALLASTASWPLTCAGVSHVTGFSYSANVSCLLNGDAVHYTFTKPYDHPFHAALLALIALLTLIGAYRLLQSIVEKTRAIEEGRLAVAIEAKLVHDLKKGVLLQLNQFTTERAPDLVRHRHYLTLLNKYVALLGHNLRREREAHWIPLTRETCTEYFRWILGDIPLHVVAAVGGAAFVTLRYDAALTMESHREWPAIFVPEMAFYRIVKNIVENYHTHGYGGLTMTLHAANGWITLGATNAAPMRASTDDRAPHLGLVIIRQLLTDNFGAAATMTQQCTATQYALTLRFPLVPHA